MVYLNKPIAFIIFCIFILLITIAIKRCSPDEIGYDFSKEEYVKEGKDAEMNSILEVGKTSDGTNEEFYMEYPPWNKVELEDPDNLVALEKEDKICSFQLNKIAMSPELYEKELKDYARQKGRVDSEDPLRYSLDSPEGRFVVKTAYKQCLGYTYYAFYSCLEDHYDAPRAAETFDSMRCTTN